MFISNSKIIFSLFFGLSNCKNDYSAESMQKKSAGTCVINATASHRKLRQWRHKIKTKISLMTSQKWRKQNKNFAETQKPYLDSEARKEIKNVFQ